MIDDGIIRVFIKKEFFKINFLNFKILNKKIKIY